MKWEYKTYVLNAKTSFWGGKFKSESLDEVLNRFGDEGWELVNTVSSNHGYGDTRCIFLFLKEKQKYRIRVLK